MIRIKCQCGRISNCVGNQWLLCRCGNRQWVSLVGGQSALLPRRTSRNRQTTTNAWTVLHEYPPQHEHDWNPAEASRWYDEWCQSIPSIGCQCRKHWHDYCRQSPPPFHAAAALFEWGIEAHGHVSETHVKKPGWTVDEGYAVYWPQKYRRGSLDPYCAVVTSLNPNPARRERQRECLQSWIDFGLSVYVVNTPGEIAAMAEHFPEVQWIAQVEQSSHYPFKSPLISNMAKVACTLDRRIVLLNSDCEIRGRQSQLLKHIRDDDTQFIGIRWDHGDDRSLAVEQEWGLDMFAFTPQHARLLPENMPFAIGQPTWDYAVPLIMRDKGIRLNIMHERLLFHQKHELAWSNSSWIFGRDWLNNFYGNSFADGKTYRRSLDPKWVYTKDHGCYVTKDWQQSTGGLVG